MDLNPWKSSVLSAHAREKMLDRGASENEVETAIRKGIQEPARKGRQCFAKTFLSTIIGGENTLLSSKWLRSFLSKKIN